MSNDSSIGTRGDGAGCPGLQNGADRTAPMPVKPKSHSAQMRKLHPHLFPSKVSDPFYGSARWKALRAMHLAEHPLCDECEAQGDTVTATVVDHKLERQDRPDLELDPGNLRSLCSRHHSIKTRAEAKRRAGRT